MGDTMQKVKVSLTLDRSLVAEIDRRARQSPRPNRSQVVEQALRAWVRASKRDELDEDIVAYYRALSREEEAEDSAWAELGDETVRTSWDEPR